MIADPMTENNPYELPSNSVTTTWRLRLIGWLLIVVAIVAVIISIPIAWDALELVNQEYLHIWTVRHIKYDFEFNGAPVSIDFIIQISSTTVFTLWGIAIGLTVLAKMLLRKRDSNDSATTGV